MYSSDGKYLVVTSSQSQPAFYWKKSFKNLRGRICIINKNGFSSASKRTPMHYRLRPMERRAQEFRNFVSHFIHIQIFQMEISSLSLILIAPKYSRQIYRGRNEHILIFLFNFTAKYKKKRDELNSVKYFTQETGAQIFAKHNFQL